MNDQFNLIISQAPENVDFVIWFIYKIARFLLFVVVRSLPLFHHFGHLIFLPFTGVEIKRLFCFLLILHQFLFLVVSQVQEKRRTPRKSSPILPSLELMKRKEMVERRRQIWKIGLFRPIPYWSLTETLKLLEMTILLDL